MWQSFVGAGQGNMKAISDPQQSNMAPDSNAQPIKIWLMDMQAVWMIQKASMVVIIQVSLYHNTLQLAKSVTLQPVKDVFVVIWGWFTMCRTDKPSFANG